MLGIRTYVLTAACGAALLSGVARGGTTAEDTRRDEDAKQVAVAWFNAVLEGRTAVATSLSAVPFTFGIDGVARSLGDLRKFYDRLIKEKGKRSAEIKAVRVKSSSPEKVVVELVLDGEEMSVSVKPGDACRVTGFSGRKTGKAE